MSRHYCVLCVDCACSPVQSILHSQLRCQWSKQGLTHHYLWRGTGFPKGLCCPFEKIFRKHTRAFARLKPSWCPTLGKFAWGQRLFWALLRIWLTAGRIERPSSSGICGCPARLSNSRRAICLDFSLSHICLMALGYGAGGEGACPGCARDVFESAPPVQCTTASQCDYHGCSDRNCNSSSVYCVNGHWKQFCVSLQR